MRRYGPLHPAPHGLLVGDPGRKHLSLSPEGLGHHDGDKRVREIPWRDITSASLSLQTTRFRFPGAFAGVWSGLLVALTQTDPGLDLKAGAVDVATAKGALHLELDRHHPGGYWKPVVESAQMLLDRLVENPESRELLNHPDELISTVAASARAKKGGSDR